MAIVQVPAAKSAFTLINRTEISTSATATIDNLFSNTYENYKIDFTWLTSVSAANVKFQIRYGSTTFSSANYKYGFEGPTESGGVSNVWNGNNTTDFPFPGSSTGTKNSANFMVTRLNNSDRFFMSGQIINPYNAIIYSGGMYINTTQEWSGLYISTSSGTLTGIISIYGLAKS